MIEAVFNSVNMTLIIKIIIICLSITYIYNFTDFIENVAKNTKKLLFTLRTKASAKIVPWNQNSENLQKLTNFNNNFVNFNKPFGCYSCMCFWTSFIFALTAFNLINALAIGLIFHLLSRVFKKLIGYLIDLIERF